MRDIKFRIWDNKYKRLNESFDLYEFIKMGDGYSGITDFIVEQYTGHKDVDGVEIYEGDIVEYDFHASCSGTGRLTETIEWDEWKNGWCRRDFLNKKNNIKVIGNIHETSGNRIEGV